MNRSEQTTTLAALNVQTGNRLWSRDFENVDGYRPFVFERQNSVVAVVPVRHPSDALRHGVQVASHRSSTGQLLWEATYGAWAEQRAINVTRVVRRASLLYMAGTETVFLDDGGWISSAIVLAVDMRNGARVWERKFGPSEFPGDPERRNASIHVAAVQGRTLVVAGDSFTDAGRTHFVAAYDARSGDTAWLSEHVEEDGISERVSLVVLGRKSVFVVAQRDDEYSWTKLSAYDRRTGAAQGERDIDLTTRSAVIARGGSILLAGTLWRTRNDPRGAGPMGLITAFEASIDLAPKWYVRAAHGVEDLVIRKKDVYARTNHDILVVRP